MTRTSYTTQEAQRQVLAAWVAMKTESQDQSWLSSWTQTVRAHEAYSRYSRNLGSVPMARQLFVVTLGVHHDIVEQTVLGSRCLPLTLVHLSEA